MTATAAPPPAAALPAATPPPSGIRSAEKKRIVLRRYVAQEEKERQQAAAAAAAANGSLESAEKRKRGGGERLNDAQRLEIIRRRREENPPSLRSLAREFNVSDKSIRNVMLCAEEIEKRNVNVDLKHQMQTFRHAAPRFPELEERVYQWIMSLRKIQINPTPSSIIEKAKVIAAEMGIPEADFKASPGWFERFRKRRHLVDKRMSVGGYDGDEAKAKEEENAQAEPEEEQSGEGRGEAAQQDVQLSQQLQQQQQQQQQQQLQQIPVETVGVYDLLHRLVEFENQLRVFQRLNPPEHSRLQQCLANASVIRHDLLAVHANMQVRTLRASSGTPPSKASQHHALNELVSSFCGQSADMSANSDEDAVDALAAYIRARFVAPLAHIQATAAAATPHAGDGDDPTLDALVPALRKPFLITSSSSVSSPPVVDAAAWKRVLLMVFRRFAGHLIVRGKLLNQEELLVSHFCRLDAVSSRPHGPSVRIPESLSLLRFVLPCEDGLVEQVGRDDVVVRVKPASYPASVDGEEVVVVVASRLEEDSRDATITPSMWEDARVLTDLDTLYGFDVRYLLQTHNAIASRLTDESEDSANAVIARAPAFSDLRCTQMMMRSYGIQSSSSNVTRRFESFAIQGGGSEAGEESPRSYVSLGKAQKKRWADERLASGQELVGKGHLKDALAEFSSCLKLDEEHVGAFFARAEAFASLQQFPDAIRDLEMVKRLDAAFPGLNEALLRARSKLKHSRHVEIPSSLVSAKGASLAGRHSLKSRSGSKVHSDDYFKDFTMRGDATNPSQDSRERVRRSQSSSSSLSKPRAAEANQHQSSNNKNLERDRLRRLLEEEVGGERNKKQYRRKKSTRARSSDDENEDDDSSDDSSIVKKRKSSSTSSKKKKKRTHDETRERSSRKSSKKKHKSRRRSDESSSDSSSDGDSSSDSDRSKKSRRKKKMKKSHSRRSSRRERSESRGRSGKDDAPVKDEPHPILGRQRHRIWN